MKKELLLQMLEVNKKQTKALVCVEMDTFQRLMDEKQLIINKIEELHRVSPELRLQSDEAVLREIVQIDQMNRIEFNRQFEEVQQKMRQLKKQRQVENVYSNPYDVSREEGVFFDKR